MTTRQATRDEILAAAWGSKAAVRSFRDRRVKDALEEEEPGERFSEAREA